MGIGIKHCSLMMSLTRPFKIQNGMDFFLNHLEDVNYPKKGAMVRPCISVVVGIEGFALCKNNLHPFCSYHVVFKVVIQFSIFVLLLVQTI